MNMEQLLRNANIRTAAVIDDVYDEMPRAEDIAESAGWASFLDDLGDDKELVRAKFPAFDELDADELRHSNGFVGVIWGLKGELPQPLWDTLFDDYVRALESDRKFLEQLEARLAALGVTPKPSGREGVAALGQEDVVFIDLFLGAAQQSADMRRSISVIKDLIKDRKAAPPLVILMSSSDVLEENKVPFRDDAGLLGAMFRVHSKRDLLAPGGVERVLERLALHKEDGQRVANFIHQLDIGFDDAKRRFLTVVRRLDLSDYVHIRELLLSREGQPIGSYMLDVFDRVLQYEIEANQGTIDAAQSLNEIDRERYPLAHVAGTPDTQDLVNRTIWQHRARLKVASTVAGVPVSFGDLLLKKALLTGEDVSPANLEALLVVTPSCDLMREDGARTVLLMTGALRKLSHTDWIYGDAKARTPIVILPDGSRMWVKWDLKHPQTFTLAQLAGMLDPAGGTLSIAMRFREGQALELQQQMLADLGRVGVMAKMPATFPVQVTASYLASDGQLQAFNLPMLDAKGAVCYTGQDANAAVITKLVLSEEAVDEILLAVSELEVEAVSPRSRAALTVLQGVTNLSLQLQSGLKIRDSYTDLRVSYTKEGQPANQTIGHIARNPTQTVPSANAALVIQVSDIVRDG